MELDLLNELDDRVEALLKRLQHLQREREQLTKRLAQCELGFGETSARLREYEELRSRVRTVIQNILIRFDSLNLE
jgi:chromosome segregation ATPase